MDYFYKIDTIKKYFQKMDNTVFETIQEANIGTLKYEALMDELMNVIIDLLEDNEIDENSKEMIYNQIIILLANHIGCTVDAEKYGNIMNKLFNENKITREQFCIFNENLNLGRWN